MSGLKTITFSPGYLYDLDNLNITVTPRTNCSNISRFWVADSAGNTPCYNQDGKTYINLTVEFKYTTYPAYFGYFLMGKLLV